MLTLLQVKLIKNIQKLFFGDQSLKSETIFLSNVGILIHSWNDFSFSKILNNVAHFFWHIGNILFYIIWRSSIDTLIFSTRWLGCTCHLSRSRFVLPHWWDTSMSGQFHTRSAYHLGWVVLLPWWFLVAPALVLVRCFEILVRPIVVPTKWIRSWSFLQSFYRERF